MNLHVMSCKYCETPYLGSLVPQNTFRCGQCGKKTRVPAAGVLAEMIFTALLVAEPAILRTTSNLAGALANALLQGARKRRLIKMLEDKGLNGSHLKEVLAEGLLLVRTDARASGFKMMCGGATVLAVSAVLTILQYWFARSSGVVYVWVAGFAIAIVYSLVGLFKWLTGANVR